MSALPIANVNHGMTEGSTSGSLGNISWFQKAALQLYRRNMPLLHVSTQHPGREGWGEKAGYKASGCLVFHSTKLGTRLGEGEGMLHCE